MDVSYRIAPDAVVVSPIGRVDEGSWEEFGRHLSVGVERAAAGAKPRLVIDLSGIAYMSSRGLRALTMAKQEGVGAGVSVRLAMPNDIMREILAISRYDKIFAVDEVLPAGSEAGD